MNPVWICRLLAVVAGQTGHTAEHIFWYMPTKIVFGFEHMHYLREGINHKRVSNLLSDDSLESVLNLL